MGRWKKKADSLLLNLDSQYTHRTNTLDFFSHGSRCPSTILVFCLPLGENLTLDIVEHEFSSNSSPHELPLAGIISEFELAIKRKSIPVVDSVYT